MPFIVLAVGVILLISALNNSYSALAGALEQDIPPFLHWALAIVLLGALGFVPGLKPVSRGLMTLVLVVIFLKNYSSIFSSLQEAGQLVSVPVHGNGSGSGGVTTDIPSGAQPLIPPLEQGLGEESLGAASGYM